MGFVRDQEQVWSCHGLSQRSRESMVLSRAFQEIKRKYGPIMGFLRDQEKYRPIMGFLRDQEQVWTNHGLSQRSRASMVLSWAFFEIKSKYGPGMGFLRDLEQV